MNKYICTLNDTTCVGYKAGECHSIENCSGKKEKSNMLNELIKLMTENPDLPVIPMVDTEIVAGDEYGYWMASFGRCEIREYAINEWDRDGIIVYRDEDEEEFIETIAEYKYGDTEEGYEKAKEDAAKLWVKAILVYIELPDR